MRANKRKDQLQSINLRPAQIWAQIRARARVAPSLFMSSFFL